MTFAFLSRCGFLCKFSLFVAPVNRQSVVILPIPCQYAICHLPLDRDGPLGRCAVAATAGARLTSRGP
eukprot:9481426-Pyramimonas_sp.AAC.1